MQVVQAVTTVPAMHAIHFNLTVLVLTVINQDDLSKQNMWLYERWSGDDLC